MVCDFGRIRAGIVTLFKTAVIFRVHPKSRNWNTYIRTHNKKRDYRVYSVLCSFVITSLGEQGAGTRFTIIPQS